MQSECLGPQYKTFVLLAVGAMCCCTLNGVDCNAKGVPWAVGQKISGGAFL